jgi:hypothetical protein
VTETSYSIRSIDLPSRIIENIMHHASLASHIDYLIMQVLIWSSVKLLKLVMDALIS